MSYIPRTGAEALMPEEYQREIIQEVTQMSTIMSMGYKAPDMARGQRRLPILSVLPTAYFVNPGPQDRGDIGFKRTSRVMWENKYIDAEELAVIVAIPEAVLDDSDYDIWAEVKPKLLEAYGIAFDMAVLYGTNAPAVWPTSIVTAATAANHLIVDDGSTSNDLYDKIMSENGLLSKIEEDGFDNSGFVGHLRMKARLRGLRDANGLPIFKSIYKEGMQGGTLYNLDGESIMFPKNGAIDPDRSLMIAGDWSKLMYAMRKDITWKLLTEAVIQDPTTGEILYNLAQQNMVALRSCMRLGWQVPNPINRVNEDDTTRYPFSVFGPAGS